MFSVTALVFTVFTVNISANTIIDQYEDDVYKIVQAKNTITIMDKETDDKAIIKFVNKNNAILTLPNKETKKLLKMQLEMFI